MPAVTLEEKERKRQRAKVRRAKGLKKAAAIQRELTEAYKPFDDWDEEELARGRPRASDGTFRGGAPSWISAKIHEEAVKRFKDIAQADVRALVPEAIATVDMLIRCEDRDERGRLVVPPSVKLQAAQWVVEHLLGKPTQRIEADISVRLQSILANVLVQPEDGGEVPALMEAESWEDDD